MQYRRRWLAVEGKRRDIRACHSLVSDRHIASNNRSKTGNMTSFTKVSDHDKPLIEVDAEKKLSPIDPMTYGGFTEYVVKLRL